MKNVLKKNIPFIIICLILFSWGSIEMCRFKIEHDNRIKRHNEVVERCNNGYYDNIPGGDKNCEEVLQYKEYHNWDTITIFFYVILHGSISNLQLIAPIFIIIVAVWQFNKELKSGYFKNILMRMRYSDYLKKTYLKVLKYSLIFPVFLIFMFVVAYSISGHFNLEQTLIQERMSSSWLDFKFVKIFPQFSCIYLLNFILHSIFWTNIGFIMSKKSRNVFLTIISSFLVYVAIFIFTEIFIGGFFFSGLLGIRNVMDYFSLSNIWLYEGIEYLGLTVLYSLILVISSLIALIFSYKNKEEVIIENEI